jgi:hypothetical protein
MQIRNLSPQDRALDVRLTIDPGFVHYRLIETIVGQAAADFISSEVAKLPSLPEGILRTRINHIYSRLATDFCAELKVPTLRELLARGCGRIFCSTENLPSCPEVYEADRMRCPILIDGDYEYSAELVFSTEHIFTSTLRDSLHRGTTAAIIAILSDQHQETLSFQPLVIGFPWLSVDDPRWTDKIAWWRSSFFENFIEDFDEFGRVASESTPADFSVMSRISEAAFKQCLAEILGDSITRDWGGERSDHYAAHLHLQGKRVTAAFLLKGPARFRRMTLNSLGKQNDQIYRLAQEPAEVLVVQHCHDITTPVRATLRAFAVQPCRVRRYCLIDGRDSLRLLNAYGKVERALELSKGATV